MHKEGTPMDIRSSGSVLEQPTRLLDHAMQRLDVETELKEERVPTPPVTVETTHTLSTKEDANVASLHATTATNSLTSNTGNVASSAEPPSIEQMEDWLDDLLG